MWRLVRDLSLELLEVGGVEGALEREQLVEDHANRPRVHHGCVRLTIEDLWRHVVCAARHGSKGALSGGGAKVRKREGLEASRGVWGGGQA